MTDMARYREKLDALMQAAVDWRRTWDDEDNYGGRHAANPDTAVDAERALLKAATEYADQHARVVR